MNPHEQFTQQEQRETHQIFLDGFISRYLERSGILGKVAFGAEYDPSSTISDYNRTWWEAKPGRFSIPVGNFVLGQMHKMSGREIKTEFASKFYEKAGAINSQLADSPVAIINGHSPDLQAALGLFSANIGLAERDKEDFGTPFNHGFYRRTEAGHGIATRATAPIVIGSPRMPIVEFVRLQRLVVNPHLSFPRTKQIEEAGIDPDFIKKYNSKLRREIIEIANNGHANFPLHGALRTLWSLAPNAQPDLKPEGTDKQITARVGEATQKMVEDMGCALLPVYTSFGKGERPNAFELGAITKPEDVTSSTLGGMMADLAEFRRKNGEPNVYYAGELDLVA